MKIAKEYIHQIYADKLDENYLEIQSNDRNFRKCYEKFKKLLLPTTPFFKFQETDFVLLWHRTFYTFYYYC